MARSNRPDVIVPEDAAGRGSIMMGELRTKDKHYPAMLAQFSKIRPHTKNAHIYLFPTVEQAKLLYECSGPFTFEATFAPHDGVIESHKAEGIWLKSIAQIVNREAIYWTQTSGRIDTLQTKMTYLNATEVQSRSVPSPAWFVAGTCFALQIIANADKEEIEAAIKGGYVRADISLTLSNGTLASVHRYTRFHKTGARRQVRRTGYAITVSGQTDPEITKRDVDTLLILASFASRERTINAHWSTETQKDWTRNWRFNFAKFARRGNHEDPLALRDREECRAFLQEAFDIYRVSPHQPLLDSAIYALLDKDQTLEVKIAHLFSGIQGALTFATQPKSKAKRLPIGELYRRFIKKHPGSFDKLWPLLDPRNGVCLADFRHAIVHGEAFQESDWLALSYAGDHLRWHLERVILISLGADFAKSHVSDRALRNFYSYNEWIAERSKQVLHKNAP